MRARALLVAVSAIVLLAAMFVAVHRNTRGHALVEEIGRLTDTRTAAMARSAELRREIEELRSRPRIVKVAEGMGLHVPSEEELTVLDLTSRRGASEEGSSP